MVRIILLIICLFFFVISCSPVVKGPPIKETAPSEAPVPGTTKPSWQVEWEKTLEAARKEGILTAYTGYGPEITQPLREAFKQKFGIEIDFLAGRGAELRSRLFAERRAGLYLVDLQVRGLSGIAADLKPAGFLNPLEPLLVLPEVLEPRNWWEGKLPWVDEDKFIFKYFATPTGAITINTSVVNPKELNSYQDLLDSKWKGKIIMNDPTTTGSGNSWFYHMDRYIMGRDYMKALGKQELFLTRDLRLMSEWIVRGKYPLGIGAGGGTITEMIKLGAPVEEKILSEGGYLSASMGGLALINRAPHPHAAKIFVNWILTKEVQNMLARAYEKHSLRIDVPTDFLRPFEVRQTGVKYHGGRERDETAQVEWIKVAAELWGHLLR